MNKAIMNIIKRQRKATNKYITTINKLTTDELNKTFRHKYGIEYWDKTNIPNNKKLDIKNNISIQKYKNKNNNTIQKYKKN